VPGAMGWPRQNAAAADIRRAAARADDPEHMSLWAGQAAALAGPDRPAADVMDEVMDGALAEMRRLGRMAGA
jgi:nitronate monooxygenase